MKIIISNQLFNKANLRDLIAATGLVTLFGLCDLEIGPVVLENNRDFLPCPFQLCVLFHSHQCIQLGLTARKRSNRIKISMFLSPMTTKLDKWHWKTIGWHWKTIGRLFYTHKSCMYHFIAIGELFRFELQSGNGQIEFWPLWQEHSQKGVTDGRTDGLNHS